MFEYTFLMIDGSKHVISASDLETAEKIAKRDIASRVYAVIDCRKAALCSNLTKGQVVATPPPSKNGVSHEIEHTCRDEKYSPYVKPCPACVVAFEKQL